MIYHISKWKNKNHIITSVDIERQLLIKFDTIYDFKTFQKVGIEGTHLNVIKVIYDKSTANVILNNEKLEAFPPRSGIRQKCPLLPHIFSKLLEILARAIRQEKQGKGIQTGREEVKLSLFEDDILYIDIYIYAILYILLLLFSHSVMSNSLQPHRL